MVTVNNGCFLIFQRFRNRKSVCYHEKNTKVIWVWLLLNRIWNFRKAPNDVILRNIKKLSTKKPSQFNDVPTKWNLEIQKFSNVFTLVITDDYNNYLASTEVIPIYKKDKPTEKKLKTGRLVYFSKYFNFMRDLCMIISVITLMMFHQNFSAASEKVFSSIKVTVPAHFKWVPR